MIKKIMLGMALLGLCALTARAAEINPFALVVNGVPNSPTDELNYLNTAIRVWNGDLDQGLIGTETYSIFQNAGVPRPLQLVLSDISCIKDPTPRVEQVSLGVGPQYIVVHWGGQQDQEGGADSIYYYSGNEAGVYDLIRPTGISLGGISSITTIWGSSTPPDNNVPDGGTTLALFGIGLCGLYTVSRKLKK